jgi:hypothetical protein
MGTGGEPVAPPSAVGAPSSVAAASADGLWSPAVVSGFAEKIAENLRGIVVPPFLDRIIHREGRKTTSSIRQLTHE